MYEPWIGDDEVRTVLDAVETGWVSSAGAYLEQFEKEWAERVDRRHGVAVSNGTAALQLAIAALDLPPRSEVIIPTFTIMSCALAVIYNGHTPVLVDADPHTWCMDAEQLAGQITDNTSAIMMVHIYGHPVHVDSVLELADLHDLAIIEDAAEAHAARYRLGDQGAPIWKPCGSFGDVSVFSFYANKAVTTGEGGMLVTDDDGLAGRARALRNLSFGDSQRFRHERLGFNFRMTNLQAALGVAQIARLEEVTAAKRDLARTYSSALAGLPLQLPVEREWAHNVYWMYGVVVDESTGLTASDVASSLRERGIETRPFFLGMHAQPALTERGLFIAESYPVADWLASQGLYLPSSPNLGDESIDRVIDGLREIFS